mgnify:CR=1 FL=1
MSDDFKMKRWLVMVLGHGDVTFDAPSRGKAQAKAFRAYQAAYDACTFRDFLKRSRVTRQHDVPPEYGMRIEVDGEPAFMIGYSGSNSLRFVRPGEEQIFTSHLLDTNQTTEKTDADIPE